MKLAQRLQSFESHIIRQAFTTAAKVKNPLDLSIGYPEGDTPWYIKLAGIKAISAGRTRYTPANGIAPLREGIARKLERVNHISVTPDEVTVTPGVTTAVLLSYLALIDPGDELIVPDPYFPPYRDLATMLGAKVVLVDTFPDFRLTAEKIAPLITNKTRVIALNSPNNPTGAVYPETELRKIAELAKKHDLTILSDEIYEYFTYGVPHFSLGSIYPKTITLNGFSKAYSMTGWRIGYMAGPREMIEAVNELQQYIVFSTSSIAQYAALAAIKRSPDKVTAIYRKKHDLTGELLAPLKPAGMAGAFFTFLKTPDGVSDIEFSNKLAEKRVVVLPGRAFSSRDDYIRISYAKDLVTLKQALPIVTSFYRM